MSRAMQNLTSRYNYIYNANLILNQHQEELAEAYADNYDEVLPVYVSPEPYDIFNDQPGGNLPEMEEIIKKARVLLLEKTYGNYQDDAYLLLGKANFYNGNYFNAEEYFDYTAKTYPNNIKSQVQALDWKARSLMQLGKYSQAAKVLDTLSNTISSLKKYKAEPLATIAQIYIHQRMAAEAIAMLEQAIKAHPSKPQRIRWNYILAQLYEKQENYTEALRYYRKVEKSSAPFEMYFNANLNRIKLNAFLSGVKINKQQQLLAMLRDDKNEDYHDQIYYQVAESYARDENYTEADKYYKLSLRNSTKNMYQKGLSYLKIADLNFKHFQDYLNAKLYYDSTVNTLPKSYPGYELIVKKNQNLEYLTDRYELIALQDTLQSLAKLPETERLAKVRTLIDPIKPVAVTTSNTVNSIPRANPFPSGNEASQKNQSTSNFYFANQTAISTGFNDFKKKWGNRKLELNWRQSIKSSAQETNQGITKNYLTNNGQVNPDSIAVATTDTTSKIKAMVAAIPTTAALLAKSDQQILEAYYEIANFYLQELNSPKEASEVYEILLKRFPNNDRLASIYYGLFLANKTIDPAKSETYKQKVLKEFASSSYAKTILDPSFSLKQSEMEVLVNKQYNDLFELYLQKDFSNVILKAEEVLQANPDNYLAPQFAYLKAIAIGRTSHVDQLITAFEKIKLNYPNDQLIVPLVKEHLGYINQHLEEFKQRGIALADFDANEPKFFAQQFPAKAVAKTNLQNPQTAEQTASPEKPVAKSPLKEVIPVPVAEKPVTAAPVVKTEGIFNTATSNLYYYVIHVADGSLTLSSSRFGIGQFNRGNHAENNLRHQLKEFDNDQLIFVGNFGTFEDAKTYAEGINPQLKQIMKVPANLYKSFIISKENFDKLSSKDLLNKYLEFYKNNY